MSYKDLQESFLRDSLVENFQLETVTLIRIGGYNARPYSSELQLLELPRSQSIKGIWRWWARALINGALIELGIAPPDSITVLNKQFLDPILGSNKFSSKFGISVVINQGPKGCKSLCQVQQIPRIRLLAIKREELTVENEKYPEEMIFNVRLMEIGRASSYQKNFAVSSLTLAMVLGGLGSMTTRGFGKFRVELSKYREIQHILNELYGSQNEQGISKGLGELIDMSVKYAKEYLEELNQFNGLEKTVDLPLNPAISRRKNFFRYETLGIFNDPIDALKCIGEATLKVNWKRNYRKSDKPFHTWILGLPREQGKKGEQEKRGYISKRFGRRSSALGFSVLRLNKGPKPSYGIVMYGFLTKDWVELLESPLQHIGATKSKVIDDAKNPEIGINYPQKLETASDSLDIVKHVFNAAFENITAYIKERVKYDI